MTVWKNVSIFPFFLLVILFAAPVTAQRAMPAVGDTVKGIYVGSWVQNAPESGEAFHGRPVLLEFWSTWCKPCIAAIPHLNDLETEFGDRVQFVAITQERAATAEKFVEKKEMRAAVAADTEQGSTHKVFGVSVIPRTFVLSADRVVLWTGHPTRLSRELLSTLIE
ncbi:MAG: TlpA disulfide reductase family protein [Bacteroidota bacterium]|nr:TlpA disulfide reductase family protein [Bacteroidota bacterium]